MIEKFKAKGMHCGSCETIISRTIEKLDGIHEVKVDYPTEIVEVEFDPNTISIGQIKQVVDNKGYSCLSLETEQEINKTKKDSNFYSFDKKIFGILFGIVGILVAGYFIFHLAEGIAIPEISQNMGYGLLLVVGLLTGFHCVSMCGGFVIGYTSKNAKEGKKSYKSHFQYGTGKIISYTIIGAIFGLLGSIITFTPMMRGVAGIIAGLFLVIFGLNMFGAVPWLRKIRLKTPKSLNKFVNNKSDKTKSPLVIGLLNGLMIACGPLQAIYIMAAGTGSMIEGAKILFVFALGTLPVMLGFGFLTTLISSKATNKILKASGFVVIILGLVMLNRGLALTGTGFDTSSILASVSAANNDITGNAISLQDGYQVINMEVNRYGWSPDKFILKKGVPVKWVINGKEINGCNNAIQVPKLGLEFDIKKGEQTIEFTPNQEGVISWSCWMGMIPGTFVVKDDIDLDNTAEIQKELDAVPKQVGGSCGGGSGCGCGGGK